MQSITDDEIEDLIRMGHKSKEFERDRDFWLSKGWSTEEINMSIQLANDFESGKLILEMKPEDKKRLIKKNIVLFKKLGFSDEETEEIVRDSMKNFIPLTKNK